MWYFSQWWCVTYYQWHIQKLVKIFGLICTKWINEDNYNKDVSNKDPFYAKKCLTYAVYFSPST